MNHITHLAVHVTPEEYAQFLADKTYLPECIHTDSVGYPNCAGQCPHGLVCVTFIYTNPEEELDVEWYACATPEEAAKLGDRAVPYEVANPDRRVKFVSFTL
jgi:hypothetical protein